MLATLWYFFFYFTLHGQQEEHLLQKEEPLLVNSGEALYDGKEISLVGEVVVQHSLGQISAHRLSLLPSSNQDNKNKFSLFKISDDIQIDLKEGGKLICQKAEIDYSKMEGLFFGNDDYPDVVYMTTGKEEEKEVPLKSKVIK